MIKLLKGNKPQILIDNEVSWTADYVAKRAAGQKLTDAEAARHRHPEIKTALKIETHKKCAYCESKPLHVTHGDVEHIVPKSLHPNKAYEWGNLTLACDGCNTNKGAKEDIVDPYLIDPVDVFIIYGALILPRPESGDAIYTEKSLKLNRLDLVERREKRIKELYHLVCLARNAPDDKSREAIKQDIIENEVLDSVEYAAFSKKYVMDMIAEGIL
ncbi:HNH endonuclease [Methylobacterium sp. E-016]|uniref:HNH endonuclease n=1 Tax=Methylobacterium sp. E-016 TaxID=2836556 RepID=UPI001FBC0D2C|nr:HNH endonuclease [Methylobacterium sp. E-016]MCJ2074242.1 HNH endonuclease [Methylobacterium sp. E-016]